MTDTIDSPSPERKDKDCNASAAPDVEQQPPPLLLSPSSSSPVMVRCPNNDEIDDDATTKLVVHELLARQLEYYFSATNLATDTYVSTLRSLNDGYVPISIIANFGKVQALVLPASAELAWEAVRSAASDFSDLLEVVEVDTKTGKRVVAAVENGSPKKTTAASVLAVGPVSGEPIPTSQIIGSSVRRRPPQSSTPAATERPTTTSPGLSKGALPSPTGSSSVQNTVIIREAPDGTEEETIRKLFDFDACPAIQSVHMDLQNCWFVTLDTSSRDAMFNVMFKLRTMKFPTTGESVKARLKSSPSATAVSPSPVAAMPTLSAFYNHQLQAAATMFAPNLLLLLPPQGANQTSSNSSGGRKKRGSNNKNRGIIVGSNKSKDQGQQQQQQLQQSIGNNVQRPQKTNGQSPKRNGGKEGTRQSSSSAPALSMAQKAPVVLPQPPAMDEQAFPSLPLPEDSFASGNINKVEVEKVPDQRSDIDDDELFEKTRGSVFSDSSSTATASTSSTPSPMQPNLVMGDYAAALMKAAPPSAPTATKTHQTKPTNVFIKQGTTAASSGRPMEKTKEHPQGKEASQPPVSVTPPSWGKGRTFADVLRPEQTV